MLAYDWLKSIDSAVRDETEGYFTKPFNALHIFCYDRRKPQNTNLHTTFFSWATALAKRAISLNVVAKMSVNDAMSPVVEFVKILLERFVQWNVDHEWIARKSLLLVSPGEGLDAKALELADAIGFEADSMKVMILGGACILSLNHPPAALSAFKRSPWAHVF